MMHQTPPGEPIPPDGPGKAGPVGGPVPPHRAESASVEPVVLESLTDAGGEVGEPLDVPGQQSKRFAEEPDFAGALAAGFREGLAKARGEGRELRRQRVVDEQRQGRAGGRGVHDDDSSCSSVDDTPKVERGPDGSSGSSVAAPSDWNTGHVMPDLWPPLALMALSNAISVDPSEVSAVTQNQHFPDRTNVYLRGGGTAHLIVHRPMTEVLNDLVRARLGDPGP